ncbi:acetyltransferase (GNAT) family domain-containing protein [Ditylenchus destructor]|nr:acetyltransferase (GNAT) family domain-containing protein [Ditylenchus destructor]
MVKCLMAVLIISMFMGAAGNKKEWKVTFAEGTDESPPTIYCNDHPSSKLEFNRYGTRINIVQIDVDAALRKQGIAIALMTKLFQIVAKEKITEVDLTVDGGRGNAAAVALYKHFGFEWDSPHSNSMTWFKKH